MGGHINVLTSFSSHIKFAALLLKSTHGISRIFILLGGREGMGESEALFSSHLFSAMHAWCNLA